jgi:hypothetical protein
VGGGRTVHPVSRVFRSTFHEFIGYGPVCLHGVGQMPSMKRKYGECGLLQRADPTQLLQTVFASQGISRVPIAILGMEAIQRSAAIKNTVLIHQHRWVACARIVHAVRKVRGTELAVRVPYILSLVYRLLYRPTSLKTESRSYSEQLGQPK